MFNKTTPTEELLLQLAQARKNHSDNKDIMSSIIEKAKRDPAYMIAEQSANASQQAIDALTVEIKTRAVAEYQATKNKQPFEKVKVKIFKVFKVVNREALEAWARENFKAAVKTTYDMKMIEQFAKENEVVGAHVEEEARAEIASEL